MRKSKKWMIPLCLIVVSLTGCMVGPNYRRPWVDVPDQWNNEVKTDEDYSNLIWWQQFDDSVLNELIQIALVENNDLRVAAARVDEFLGIYRVTRSGLYPKVYGEASYGRERLSEKVSPSSGIKNPSDLYTTLLSANWELDFWGKIRRATEASCADLLAEEEARQTVVLTLVTSVATAYIDLLRLDRQLEISKQTARTRLDTLELFTKRHEAGVISLVTLSQIRSEYELAVSRIPFFENLIEQQENAIRVLLGKNPGPIARGGTIDNLKPPEIPWYMPSDLLMSRPDIREAEKRLMAANARIGVARAAYFPTISLTGQYGNASRELGDLFSGPANAWNYFVPVVAPIFTAGQIAGEVRAAEAVREQNLANYRQSIIVAFQEVENSLVGRIKTKEQAEAQKRQVDALSDYARLARLRYDEGYASYLEVLDSERSLFNAQLSYTDTQGNLLLTYVDLYKSVGGGWVCLAADRDCRYTENE